jgi:hypothetical protein
MAATRMSYVVIVEERDGLNRRAFGPFRSFKRAEGNAQAWGGYVLSLESEDAPEPWNPRAGQAS